MALNKPALTNGIVDLLTELFENQADLTSAQARTRFAEGLTDLIEAFVKSGDGKYQPGTLVAGPNAVTSPGGLTAIKIE